MCSCIKKHRERLNRVQPVEAITVIFAIIIDGVVYNIDTREALTLQEHQMQQLLLRQVWQSELLRPLCIRAQHHTAETQT